MEPLATAEDVEARLGRDLTSAESERIDALLADASANVRRVSTQQFTLVEDDTVTLVPSRNGRVRLPQRPVIEVTSVQDVFENDVAYLQVSDELRLNLQPLNAFEIEPYRCGTPSEIVVTYTHGYAPTTDDPPISTIPDQIIAVVCSIVGRALGTKPDQAGIIQEAIDGYSYSTGSAAAQGGLGMLASEQETCEAFRRPRSPISTFA